jgi:hypothetical protein
MVVVAPVVGLALVNAIIAVAAVVMATGRRISRIGAGGCSSPTWW